MGQGRSCPQPSTWVRPPDYSRRAVAFRARLERTEPERAHSTRASTELPAPVSTSTSPSAVSGRRGVDPLARARFPVRPRPTTATRARAQFRSWLRFPRLPADPESPRELCIHPYTFGVNVTQKSSSAVFRLPPDGSQRWKMWRHGS